MYCLLVLYAFIFISSFHLLLVWSICQELSSSEQRNTWQRQRNNDNVTSTMWQQQCDNDNMTTTMWQRQCATTTWQQQCDNMFWLLWYELDVKNKTATRLLATICWSHWSRCCGSCRKYCPALYNLFSIFHFSSSMSTSPILLLVLCIIYIFCYLYLSTN